MWQDACWYSSTDQFGETILKVADRKAAEGDRTAVQTDGGIAYFECDRGFDMPAPFCMESTLLNAQTGLGKLCFEVAESSMRHPLLALSHHPLNVQAGLEELCFKVAENSTWQPDDVTHLTDVSGTTTSAAGYCGPDTAAFHLEMLGKELWGWQNQGNLPLSPCPPSPLGYNLSHSPPPPPFSSPY